MDNIKITGLPASFALAESVCCSVGITFTAASTAVLSSSMINTRMKDTISKQAVAVQQEFKFIHPLIQCGRQFNHKMCFLHPPTVVKCFTQVKQSFHSVMLLKLPEIRIQDA